MTVKQSSEWWRNGESGISAMDICRYIYRTLYDSENIRIVPRLKVIVTSSMVAAVVLVALRRLLNDDFPDPCEFFIETASGMIVSQPRLPFSRSEWQIGRASWRVRV